MTAKKIRQAVILCGGLGTRLRPFTDNLPKPMVLVNGRPFLHYLLAQLSEQGIKNFVLLTGYLGEQISNYFGDGVKYGWSISYSQGPVEWDTGRRIWEARDQFDPLFLLLYSDNFAQFNLYRLLELHAELGMPITLLLAPKLRGNIKVDQKGRIQAYDKNRSGEGFDFVEIGYMAVNKKQILDEFPKCSNFPNFSFSEVLKNLAKVQKIAGLVVRDNYHSISDPERLSLMSSYLKPKKILLIDRDGTLNIKAPQGQYITSLSEFQWIPESIEALRLLASHGFEFIVITNQAGIARKMLNPDELENIHRKMISDLANVGANVLKVYSCPDHWDDHSFMRKPEPGMFFEAAKDFNLRMDRVLYVGDDVRDCVAAENAGCGMVYLSPMGSNASAKGSSKESSLPFFNSPNLLDSIEEIVKTYEKWERIDNAIS